MRARLDHIGIAVANLDDALAFYRDALGLEIDPPEDVQSQRVRAHFIPAGQAALELLEATAVCGSSTTSLGPARMAHSSRSSTRRVRKACSWS